MSLRLCRALVVLAWLLLVKAAPAAEDFRLITSTVNIPERGAVASYVLLTQTNQFSFLPPPDWRAKVNAEKKIVTLTPRNLLASISFQVMEEDAGTTRQLHSGPLREQLLDRFPRAKIIREFPCYAGNGKGTAFDLERIAANKSKIFTRIALVPYSGVTIEFNLTTPARNFEDYQLTFGNLLTSFRLATSPAKDKP